MTTATLQIITARAQADKAISSLKGILQGINLDQTVNDAEIQELLLWSKTYDQLISRNPFNEFMAVIQETVYGNIPRVEAIEDLFWLCQKYEGDNYYYNAVTADLQTLQGICHGILADGIINEKEIYDLSKWLDGNDHLSTHYPYDELRSIILSIISDGQIDDEEILVLKAFFSQFVKVHSNEVAIQLKKETEGISISGLCSSDPEVTFEGKSFCVTGILKRCPREKLQNDIIKLGGNPVNSVGKNTDYLIVGDNGNPAWAFSCYGRKVEKAVQLRKTGHHITMIHEFDFGDIVDDHL